MHAVQNILFIAEAVKRMRDADMNVSFDALMRDVVPRRSHGHGVHTDITCGVGSDKKTNIGRELGRPIHQRVLHNQRQGAPLFVVA